MANTLRGLRARRHRQRHAGRGTRRACAAATGLTPEIEHVSRPLGTGADGTLPLGADARHHAVGSEAALPRDDLALGAAVTARCSEFLAAFSAENAVDGDLATEWSSAGDGNDAFIEIVLGALRAVAAVGLRTRSIGDGSTDTGSFAVTRRRRRDPWTLPGEPGPGVAEVTFTGRRVRLDAVTSTGGNTGAAEVVFDGTARR